MRRTCLALRVAVAVALGMLLSRPHPAAGVPPNLSLTVTPGSMSFPDANPDMIPSLNSIPTTIQVAVRVVGDPNVPWQLTLAASDHLRSGADIITVNNVTWTASPATPPWTAGGTLALAPGQTVASGTGIVNQVGDLQFWLANLWTYAPGVYSTTATFTLSAP